MVDHEHAGKVCSIVYGETKRQTIFASQHQASEYATHVAIPPCRHHDKSIALTSGIAALADIAAVSLQWEPAEMHVPSATTGSSNASSLPIGYARSRVSRMI